MDERAWKFLESVEGTLTAVGYIPCHKKDGSGSANYRGYGDPDRYKAMGASGVTIGVGVDLGQQTMPVLEKWNVPPQIVAKVSRYVGKKKADALRELHAAPLVLTEDEARTLTLCEHEGYLRSVERDWDLHSPLEWDGVPWQAQAVFFSLCYQLGITGAHRQGPVTLAALFRGDYARAARALKDSSGWKGYQSRRRKEGELLEGVR